MNISSLLSTSLIIVIVFVLSTYILYKYYELSGIDPFIGVILGKTDHKMIVDRSIELDYMKVDDKLTAKNITSDLVNTKKLNMLKLCGPGITNCVTVDDLAMDKDSIDRLNNLVTRVERTTKADVDRLTESITSMFSQTEKDITQNRSLLNNNIQRENELITISSKKINDLISTIKPINSDTIFNLQKNIDTKKKEALTRYTALQTDFNTVQNTISKRIASLEHRFSLPPRKLWILFGAYNVGYQVSYTMPYSKYPYMTFTPNVTSNWLNLSGLRCSPYRIDPTTALKNLYGIELIRPDGTSFEKGSFGNAFHKFYIRIAGGTNQGKLCKYDTEKNLLVAVNDPGLNRGNEYYFYFMPSHHPNWYYMASSLNNYFAIHNHFYIRFINGPPRQTQNDAFLWMIV